MHVGTSIYEYFLAMFNISDLNFLNFSMGKCNIPEGQISSALSIRVACVPPHPVVSCPNLPAPQRVEV